MTDQTPIEPLPGDGPPQSVPPAAGIPPPPGAGAVATDTTSDERTWAMLAHLSALLVFTAIPFAHILGPLVVWLVKREEFPLVNDQGKESLNFQISMTIYGIVAAILVSLLIGIFLGIALMIAWLVLVIVASIKAHDGVPYRYPLTIRFIS